MNPAEPVEVLPTPAAMRGWADEARRVGQRVVAVPTMGALHDGHRSLIELARRHGERVVVSVFVNPLQFDNRADLDRYPRPIDDDLAICAEAGADAVYAPTPAAMYPPGFATTVEPGPLADQWEGASRPGHFRGVTTVVCKLFAAMRPHFAVFGEKDFQQLAIIRRMVTDLDLGIEIVAAPTRREHDGLAMSSRNRRLDDAERAAAVVVSGAIRAVQHRFAEGQRDAAELTRLGREAIGSEPMARLDYFALVEPDALTEVGHAAADTRAITAVWFGQTRLIDNAALGAVMPPTG